MNTVRRAAVVVAFALTVPAVHAEVVEKLVAAATELHAALPEDARAVAFRPFEDAERERWSYFPGEHPGLSLAQCPPEAKPLVLATVRAALSGAGFEQTEMVRQLDDVLEGDGYSSLFYFLTVWGQPSAEATWAMKWEGHHLSLNWLIQDGRIMASTPQFIGSNPAEVRVEGPLLGHRAQAQEEDLARALITGLDAEQQSVAIASGEAIREVVTAMKPKVRPDRIERAGEESGIGYGALNTAQQAQLRELIQVYIDVQSAPVRERRASVLDEAALAETRFAWFGGLEPGQPHYYRILAPTYVIEYANTQNGANHIHTVWRDFDNDFGRDVLAEHLALFHP